MRAGPDLAGRGRMIQRRIVQRPQRADRRVDEGREEILAQVERDGEDAHDAGGEVLHRAVIGDPGLPEALGTLGPDRRRVAEGERLRVVEAGRRGIRGRR